MNPSKVCWWLQSLVVSLAIFACPVPAANACSIFVLTDGERTLFFNNEDFSNPSTRVWFVPAGKDYLGCAYVGFDDGWGQGGVNTAGLAYDWVAGVEEKWVSNPAAKPVRGNPAQRMLESCTTVEEAIEFFQHHQEPSFARARIMIADRTGASVIIGARDNQLTLQRAHQNNGFGYGGETLAKMLANPHQPLVTEGLPILRACVQKGEYATKYSTVYDLRSGDIEVFGSINEDEGVKLNLAAELTKGPHYYDIPKLRGQLSLPPMALRLEMKRFYLDEFPPIEDPKPELTRRVERIIQDSANGAMRAGDYAEKCWAALAPQQKAIQGELQRLGRLVSLKLVGREVEAGRTVCRYLVEFDKITVLQRIALDADGKVESIQSEASEVKPGMSL